ncbi:hypothetical protein OK016_22340 [Vibrio chagasii]|nr:hypothetical protein [Vibrio chagasii]
MNKQYLKGGARFYLDGAKNCPAGSNFTGALPVQTYLTEPTQNILVSHTVVAVQVWAQSVLNRTLAPFLPGHIGKWCTRF